MKTKKLILLALLVMATIGAYAQTTGYEKSIEVGGSVGIDKYSKYGFGIAMINGYRVNDTFYLGVGAGYKYSENLYMTSSNYFGSKYTGFTESFNSQSLIQVYARVKANLSTNDIAPFFQLDLGGSADLRGNETASSSGLIVEPAFGVNFKGKNPDSSIYVTVGYNLQGMRYTAWDLNPDNIGETETKVSAGQLSFKVGFVF